MVRIENVNNISWIDDSNIDYSIWLDGSPSNKSDHYCMQVLPDSKLPGKWVDEPCNKKT
jgi:hypothetical protein